MRRYTFISIVTSLFCSLIPTFPTAFFQPSPAAAQSQSDNIIYLNQAWSKEDREWYWHFSQGSAVLAYDIFLNLEVAGGEDLFRSDANSVRYGLIPDPPNNWNNPDGLPIGISKATVATPIKGWPAGDYVGMTCAACHSGQLKYNGKAIHIQGGGNNALDMQGYIRAFDEALRATLTDAAKFDRLAKRLGASSPDAKDKLRKRLESDSARVHDYAIQNLNTRHPWGPGRMDALALIFNRGLAFVAGNSRELDHRGCANQASLPVECPARIMDAVAGHCAGPDQAQCSGGPRHFPGR
jgi:hypothetical protein